MRHFVTLALLTTLIAVSVGVAHAQTGQIEHSALPTWGALAPEITVSVLDAPSGTLSLRLPRRRPSIPDR